MLTTWLRPFDRQLTSSFPILRFASATLVALAILAGSDLASAQSCPVGQLSQVQNTSYPSPSTYTVTEWGFAGDPVPVVNLTVNKFNVANATLKSVIAQVTGRANGSISATNTQNAGGTNETITLTLQAEVDLTGPGSSFSLAAFPTVNKVFNNVPPGGAGNPASTVAQNNVSGTDTKFTSLTTGLAAYTGAGTVTFSADGFDNSTFSTVGGASTGTSSSSAGADLQVTYCYTIPDMTITKSHTGNFTSGQVGATFTIGTSNVGNATTTGQVSVVDTPPAGLTVTAMTGTGWTCNVGTLTCTRTDTLAAGSSYPDITVTVTVASNAVGTLTNQAVVSGGGEVNLANDTALDPVTVVGIPDMTITKSHTGNFTQGQVGATFTVGTKNVGTATTTGQVSVVDTPPAGLTVTAMTGTGWTCTVGTLTCTRTDTLAAGSSYPDITVTVTVASNALGTLTNQAVVSGGGEVNLTNDTALDPVTVVGIPDMTITKSHTGNFTQGQVGATFTVGTKNVGTATTTGQVSVVDTPPAGLTVTAMTGTGWTCTVGTLTCTRTDTLAAGSSYPDITVTVTVASNALGTLTNQAVVSGGGEVNLTNDTALDPVTVVGIPDMTITKSHTGNFTAGQVGAIYTITASNVGTAATTGQVSVVDTLPAGISATAMTGTGWTCTVGTLTCTRTDALIAGSSYPPITLTVNVANGVTGTLVNTAVVSGGGEVNLANDTATDPVFIPPPSSPDPTITKTHTGTFLAGQIGATFTIIVTNVGAGSTSGQVTVADLMPVGLTATAISGTGWTCTLIPLNCTRADQLAAGASYPAITVTVNVAPTAVGTLTNLANVAGGADVNLSNNTAQDPVVITVPDMVIAKKHTGTFTQGQVGATYTLTPSNIGTAATIGTVTVVDQLPAGLTATAISGSGWTCVLGSLSCSRTDSLAIGGSYPPITVTVNIGSNVTGTIINTAIVSGGGEVNTSNDTATDPAVLGGIPDMTIGKSHTGTFTPGLVGGTFTLTTSNVGGSPTAGPVSVTDTLPAGLTATGIAGAGWSCTLGSLTCTRSDVLAAGASYPAITVTVNVAATAIGTLTNVAVVSGGGEVNLSNDTATDSVVIVAPPALIPDMTITKTHTGTFVPGQSGSFTLIASNVGQTATSGVVTVTDTLPVGLTATAISGSGWNCVLTSQSCTRSDVLAVNAAYPPITVTVNIALTASGTLTNVAVVGGGGETNTTNDTATDQVVITPPPDMTVSKSHTGTFTQGQTGVSYTITTKNVGGTPTTGAVTLTDTLPAGLTATAISGSGWTCTLSTLSCTRSDSLAVNASYPAITVTVNVSATATGTLINTAVVGGGGELNLSNDTATDPVTIGLVPDLTVTKTHTATFVRGGTASYTITVQNIGPVPTTAPVTLVDTLPTGLTATAISGPGWSCVLSTLTCTRSDVLAAGASYPAITVAVNIATNAPNSVVNTATVSGGGELNTTNDTATDPANVGDSPKLNLDKQSVGSFVAGGVGTYTLTVTNHGTVATVGQTTLTDTLPSYLTAVSMSGTGWTCSLATVSCTRGDSLDVGATYPAITLLVNIAMNAPVSIQNIANVTNQASGSTSSSSNNVPITTVDPSIKISKIADRSFASVGDVVTYTVVISNTGNAGITNVVLNDQLPVGFNFVANSARESVGSSTPQPIAATSSGSNLTFNVGSLAAQAMATITYRVTVSAQAHAGDNYNAAFASANGPKGPVLTPVVKAKVTLTPGLLSQRQFIIGRVFEDVDDDGFYDDKHGDHPMAGVRVYLSNGDSAITDSLGMYNIPSVSAGSVTISIDPTTVPKGYTSADDHRTYDQTWTRLLRTPLAGGTMLRQNFPMRRMTELPAPAEDLKARIAPVPTHVANEKPGSQKPATRIEVTPERISVAADGRTATAVMVRVLDADGKPAAAKEIRIQTSAGQFLPDQGIQPMTEPDRKGLSSAFVAPSSQSGISTERIPERMSQATLRLTEGEGKFLLLSANTPGVAMIHAETGDPEHRLTGSAEVSFVTEQRSPILVALGELAVGKAAPEFGYLGQTGDVARRGDLFLRQPFGENRETLFTFAYTSHLPVNDTAGQRQMFQLNPLDRVYPVFGDSSTQFQAAQANSHIYARLERGLSYARFGDLNGDKAEQNRNGLTSYSRNLTGVEVHLENKHHDSLTLQGARPNTAYAREAFPGSTFGLIQLSHPNILAGSETITLETRDRYNPEIVLARQPLIRNSDYTVDLGTGALFFLRSLNVYDNALNLNQVVVTYEYQTFGLSSSTYGIKADKHFDNAGLRVRLSMLTQRTDGLDPYYLGGVEVDQKMPFAGKFHLELPISHGGSAAAGGSSAGLGAVPGEVNGVAVHAELDQPVPAIHGKIEASLSKTESEFYNPFGATTLPGSQTTRGAITFTPTPGTKIRLGVTDERNKTDLVNNHRDTGSFELKQNIGEAFRFTAGYDYRDYVDNLLSHENQANEVSAGVEWDITDKLKASVRREENLSKADPTYPNQLLIKGQYLMSDTVRFFLTQRFASAPIVPIGDLSRTGFAALAGKNETSIGVEDRWNKYATIQGRYLVENGLNGSDSYAVIGLVNRIPVAEHFNLDLGLEHGQLITGKDGSFNSESVGLAYLPNDRFKASTRYELRDRGGFGQIFTAGAAGRLTDGVTMLGQVQRSSADFTTFPGNTILLNPQQSLGTQGTLAMALRPLKRDREALLFSYTYRALDLRGNGTPATVPTSDRINLLSMDGYIQATRSLDFFGKFALSDRSSAYDDSPSISTKTYLWQGRAQVRLSRRFDGAIEGRTYMQPALDLNRWTVAAEAGVWALRDLRLAVGYNFRSTQELNTNFLNTPLHRGFYFVLSTKLSNLFNLFTAPEKDEGSTRTKRP